MILEFHFANLQILHRALEQVGANSLCRGEGGVFSFYNGKVASNAFISYVDAVGTLCLWPCVRWRSAEPSDDACLAKITMRKVTSTAITSTVNVFIKKKRASRHLTGNPRGHQPLKNKAYKNEMPHLKSWRQSCLMCNRPLTTKGYFCLPFKTHVAWMSPPSLIRCPQLGVHTNIV